MVTSEAAAAAPADLTKVPALVKSPTGLKLSPMSRSPAASKVAPERFSKRAAVEEQGAASSNRTPLVGHGAVVDALVRRRPAQRQVNRVRTVAHEQGAGSGLGAARPVERTGDGELDRRGGGAADGQRAARPGQLADLGGTGVDNEGGALQLKGAARDEGLGQTDGAAAETGNAGAADGVVRPSEIMRAAVEIEQGASGDVEDAAMCPAVGQA
jgi:hypothetical protein